MTSRQLIQLIVSQVTVILLVVPPPGRERRCCPQPRPGEGQNFYSQRRARGRAVPGGDGEPVPARRAVRREPRGDTVADPPHTGGCVDGWGGEEVCLPFCLCLSLYLSV